jgi:hypothetical protein
MAAMIWIRDRAEALQPGADPVLGEALAVAMHDAVFIGAKLHRAVDGRDRWRSGEEDGDTALVQTDWNGSAKVALISIERSRTAWQTIADAANDAAAHAIAERLERLQQMTAQEFPRAMEFLRPGFDEPTP